MNADLFSMLMLAASVGVAHTLLGPDHYVPFVALGKARAWSYKKLAWITTLCGVAHVGSSIVIGLVGISVGKSLAELMGLEISRGSVAGWLLFGFGLAYTIWGIRRLLRGNNSLESNPHSRQAFQFWALFIVFALGPCEPLIPILMVPASHVNMGSLLGVCGVFMFTTVGTMLLTVFALTVGLSTVKLRIVQRFGAVIAGVAITCCGAGMVFWGS